MSNFPNPSVIININTSKTITAQKPQYLRTFAICSCGDTTLKVGESKLVSSSSYEEIMNKNVLDNYTKKWLASFFANCIGKMALIVECGTENTTITYPELSELKLTNNLEFDVGQELTNTFAGDYSYTFSYKDNDKESNKIFSINASNNTCTLRGLKAGVGYLKVVVSGKDISTTYFILKVNVKTPITWELDNKQFELNVKDDSQDPSDTTTKTYNVTTNAKSFNAVITKESGGEADENSPSVVVSGKSFVLNSGKEQGTFKLKITIQATENTMQTELEYSVKIVPKGQSLAGDNQIPPLRTVITEKTDTSDHSVIEYNEKTSYVDILKNYIGENEKTRAYKYSVPRQMMANDTFLSLVEMYSKIDSSVYFSGETIRNADPNTDPVFVKLKSRKGFFGVYNNCTDSNNILDGGISGIMASNSYDISTNNQMSPLCFKYISFDFNKTTNTFNEILTDCPVTWIGYQAGQRVLFGGRYCDGEAWDYWYSWDNVRESVKVNVETFIINAINTLGKNPLQYNKDGIKNISLNLELSLQECVTLGYINQFGESLDIATNTIKNVGKVAFIDFDNYIKSNPDDYAKGIYNGYSAFVQIGRFILQVSFNVNLG